MKHTLLHVLLAAVLSLWLTMSVWAGFDEGLAAYGRGDYQTAFDEWLPLAEQGHATAQGNLGHMYRFGQGVPQDYAEAVRWHRLAAEQGDADAQDNLGVMYAWGEGVPEDYAEAVKWYRLAAEQGHGDAQFNLGHMYLKGKGVPRDYIRAHMWFNLAAVQGWEMGRQNRESVERYYMTPADISEAQRLAREWLEEHGE